MVQYYFSASVNTFIKINILKCLFLIKKINMAYYTFITYYSNHANMSQFKGKTDLEAFKQWKKYIITEEGFESMKDILVNKKLFYLEVVIRFNNVYYCYLKDESITDVVYCIKTSQVKEPMY